MTSPPGGFERALRADVRGGVHFDAGTRGMYSTDASIYRIDPVAVVTPLDDEDVRAAVRIAAEHGVSILPRGGGTSLAGQTVGESLVLDLSKHMNALVELNTEEHWARVQPGLIRDNLNAQLQPHGLHFAPDPATANRANIGGMIGNNSSGTKSILFGKTVDHVLELRVLLADGTKTNLRELGPEEYEGTCAGDDRAAEIHRGVARIIEENRQEIERRFPKVMRRVGGYNLDEFIHPDRWNLAKLVVGSEGTLATTLEAKVNLVPLPKCTGICVVHFADLIEAIRAVEPMLEHNPSAVEILDQTVLRMARQNLNLAPLTGFIEGDPAAIQIVEFYGDTQSEIEERAQAMIGRLRAAVLGFAYPLFFDGPSKERVWTVRKNGLGLMLGIRGDRKPIPFIEDACVPVKVLPEYIDRVLQICRENETDVAMYAHASVGVIHVRPILDLRRTDDIERMKRIAEETFQLVVANNGSWSGEHGDGLVRSPWMERFFGEQIYAAFRDVKALFDPQGLMNPGKIIGSPPMDENLRYGTDYRPPALDTVYHYRKDGSFGAAVEMCTGVGACRKTLGGTMCPSYMATRDEEHSTRGRANALRLAMTGKFGLGDLTSERVREVLDLCLGCKACKAECPSNVDMAKLRSEVFQRRHDKHGAPLRDRMVAAAPAMARRMSGPLAPAINWVQSTGLFRWTLEKIAGIDRRRHLPAFARESLGRWFHRRGGSPVAGRQVALFADTFTAHHDVSVGKAAVALLEACGYQVVLATGCCQRPRISSGFLHDAKRDGGKTLMSLDELIRQGLKVVVCEPSCASALVDDLPDLIDDEALGGRIAANVVLLEQFLAAETRAGMITAAFESTHSAALVHGHCHQRAVFGTAAMIEVLSQVPSLEVTELDAGCCGMAGSFGYEREHCDLSLRIGEDRLFPAICAAPSGTAVIAPGFSCRHQIEHATGVKALHWVEAIRAVPKSG